MTTLHLNERRGDYEVVTEPVGTVVYGDRAFRVYAVRCVYCGAGERLSSLRLTKRPRCDCRRSAVNRRRAEGVRAALANGPRIPDTRWEDDPVCLAVIEAHPGGATHREIADAYGCSRQRVAQLEAVALRRLAMALRTHLRDLVEGCVA